MNAIYSQQNFMHIFQQPSSDLFHIVMANRESQFIITLRQTDLEYIACQQDYENEPFDVYTIHYTKHNNCQLRTTEKNGKLLFAVNGWGDTMRFYADTQLFAQMVEALI